MADSEKITMTLESGSSNSDSIIIKGPVFIAGVVSSYESLPAAAAASDGTMSMAIGGKSYYSGDNVTMLVDTGSSQRYYLYDWDSSKWQMVVIGSHSHSNIELLDQLGNIDASQLKDAKKMLVISTVDDGDGVSGGAYSYKLDWLDLPNGLPAIPSNLESRKCYLSANESGDFEWTNDMFPAQTFQVKKAVIAAGDDSKVLKIPGVYYKAEYDSASSDGIKSAGDQVLVFDGHDFISNFTFSVDSDNVMTLVLDEASGDTFDAGETVTVIVIRNGVSGIMDSIGKEYITKEDFLSNITNGTINLNQYLTKAEAKGLYSLKQHTHSQFAAASHNHDGVYADYHHTHNEYMTSSEAKAIVLDTMKNSSGFSGTLTEAEITSLVGAIEATYDEKINNFISTVNASIAAIKSSITTDDVKDPSDAAKTLTDRLASMEQSISDASVIQAEEVMMPTISVVLNSPLGGYSNGDVISSGEKLSAVMSKLFSQPRVLSKPTVSCKVEVADNEIGVGSTNVVITPEFSQNDGGALTAYHLTQTYPASTVAYPDKKAGGSWSLAIDISEGKSFAFSVAADYAANIIKDPVSGVEYGVDSGTASFSGEIDGVRKMFLGYIYVASGSSPAAADIRKAKHYDLPTEDSTAEINLVDTESDKTKDRYIVVAYPVNITIGDALSSVRMMPQGFEILDMFTESDDPTIIPGPDGNESSGAAYFVYKYKLDQPFGEDVELKLTF